MEVDRNLIGDRKHPMVCVSDHHGVITHANQAFLDAFGFTSADLTGMEMGGVMQFDSSHDKGGELQSCLQVGMPWCGAMKVRKKNGGDCWVEAYVVPLMARQQMVGHAWRYCKLHHRLR